MELTLPIFVRPKGKEEDYDLPLSECNIKPVVFFTIENVEAIEMEGRKVTEFDSGATNFRCSLPIDIFLTKVREAKKQELLWTNAVLNGEL